MELSVEQKRNEWGKKGVERQRENKILHEEHIRR